MQATTLSMKLQSTIFNIVLSNGDFLAGASGMALVESMQSTLKDPALRQIAAGLLGAAIRQALTGKGQAGADRE